MASEAYAPGQVIYMNGRAHLPLLADDYTAAKQRSFDLLLSILSKEAIERWDESHALEAVGASGDVYRIMPHVQTEIVRKGKRFAYVCLQLSIPAPAYDRMLTEYLLITNDERLYLRLGNVFPVRSGNEWTPASLFMLLFDAWLALEFGYQAWAALH